MTHQRTRVDALNADDAVGDHIFMQGLSSAPVAWLCAVVFDDEAAHERFTRFDVFRIDADVADLWISHRYQLAFVRGIREDLLIARHAGIENHFADRFALRAEAKTFETFTVGQCQNSFHMISSTNSLLRSPPTTANSSRACSLCKSPPDRFLRAPGRAVCIGRGPFPSWEYFCRRN